MMKSLFKEYKKPLLLGVLTITAWAACLAGEPLFERYLDNRFNDKLISVCEYEVKKNFDHPETVVFDSNLTYVIKTSNPKLWHAYSKVQAENSNHEKVKLGVFCRMVKIDNNLQVDRWEVHLEKN